MHMNDMHDAPEGDARTHVGKLTKCEVCPNMFTTSYRAGSPKKTCSDPCRMARSRAMKRLPKDRKPRDRRREIPTLTEAAQYGATTLAEYWRATGTGPSDWGKE